MNVRSIALVALCAACGGAGERSSAAPATPSVATSETTTPPMPADAARVYAALDEEIRSTFDYDTGHAHYRGDSFEVKERYTQDYERAEKQLRPRLERFAYDCAKIVCAALAHARIGSLFASMRTGIAAAPFVMPKTLRMADGRVIDLHRLMDALEQNGQREELEDLRTTAQKQWASFIAGEVEVLDQKTIVQYVAARVLAMRYGVRSHRIDEVSRGLAAMTRIYGEEKMRAMIESFDDPDPAHVGKKLVYDAAMLRE